MKTGSLSVFVLVAILFVVACSNEKRRPIYVDVEDTDDMEQVATSYVRSGDEVAIPFREEDGVKYVQVKVNGVGFEMIFDTGCSGTLISLAEANYLYQKGKLDKEDILGIAHSQIADGSVMENMVVNLKQVVIDNQIVCSNVQATVSDNIHAPLLLGNEVLNRLATITIDNENKLLDFKLK